MSEETKIFKAYQRRLLRQLVELKAAVKSGDKETAERILDHLIDDTKASIED